VNSACRVTGHNPGRLIHRPSSVVAGPAGTNDSIVFQHTLRERAPVRATVGSAAIATLADTKLSSIGSAALVGMFPNIRLVRALGAFRRTGRKAFAAPAPSRTGAW
jgi:hypothetical protein